MSSKIEIGDRVIFNGEELTVSGIEPRFLNWEFEERTYSPVEYSRYSPPIKVE